MNKYAVKLELDTKIKNDGNVFFIFEKYVSKYLSSKIDLEKELKELKMRKIESKYI